MRRHLARWAVCTAVAFAVHGSALVMILAARFVAAGPAEVIRLTLRPAGGGSAGAAPAQVAPAALPPPVAPRPRVKPAPQRRAARRIIKKAAAQPLIAVAAVPPESPAMVGPSGLDPGAAAEPGSGPGNGPGDGSGGGGGSGAGEGGDRRAYCEYCPEPGYPMIARRRGWKGTVGVQLILLGDGHVGSASVARSSGYEVLDREAVNVARRSRFRLPRRDEAAPLQGRIEYRFELLP